MRFQPPVPAMLATAKSRLERAAAETDDEVLGHHLFTPLARLMEQLGERFDTYVADRLGEIERLAVLSRRAVEREPDVDVSEINACLERADRASGRMRVNELETICDELNAFLIAFQDRHEGSNEAPILQLLADIWAEQVAHIRS